MRRAVVRPALRCRRDRQRRRVRRDFQRARRVRDVVVRRDVDAVTVLDDRCARDVVAAAHLGLAARDRHALDRVAFRQCRVRVAVLRQRRAVICFLVAVRRDRQCLLRDAQRAVRCAYARVLIRMRQHVCVRIVVLRRVAYELHARRRCGDRDRVVRRKREHLARRIRCDFRAVVRHRVHLFGVRRAVVRPALRCRRDRQRAVIRRDLQRAFFLDDRVVGLLERFGRRVNDRVRDFAFFNRRDAADRLDVGDFAGYEAGVVFRIHLPAGNRGSGQRCAVVWLLRGFAYERDGTRIDFNTTTR